MILPRCWQILIVILYASHIFGCLWWVTSRYDERRSWWEVDGLDIEDARSTYIASIYWAAATITTASGFDSTATRGDMHGYFWRNRTWYA